MGPSESQLKFWRRGIQAPTDDTLLRGFMNRRRNDREASASSDELNHSVRLIRPVLLVRRDPSRLPVLRYRVRVDRRYIRIQCHVALSLQISRRQICARREPVPHGQGNCQGMREESIDPKILVR